MQRKDVIRDSYLELIEWSGKSREDFYQFGLEHAVWPCKDLVAAEWADLKSQIFGAGEEVHVRGIGRGAATGWLLEMFSEIFQHERFEPDVSNNTYPTKMLVRVTGMSKANLVNFQVSHVIQNARNPFLFCCPWNLVWMPKYFDPLTGHETKGELPAEYSRMLRSAQAAKYADHIADYNALMEHHDLHNQVLAYLDGWSPAETDGYNPKVESSFRKTVESLFLPIDSI